MEFLKNLFKKKNKHLSNRSQECISIKSEMIKVHDEYGREIMVSKQDWLNNVLLGNIEKNYNNPDELYNLLLAALNDGFAEHIVKASKILHDRDPNKERGACLYAIVLMKNGKLTESEKVLDDAINEIGDSTVLLTNLAKVYDLKGDAETALETLWKSLSKDPNQDNGLNWYASIFAEKNGEQGYITAMQKVSDIKDAWRPYLWLARKSLEIGDKEKALAQYQLVLQRNSNPDAQVLQQISGDLGLKGFLKEAIQIVAPIFKVNIHGFIVGNNLIKAYIEIGERKAAKDLLEELFSMNRPDWREGLTYWENEIDNLREGMGPVEDPNIQIGMLAIESPVWLGKMTETEAIYTKKNSSVKILTTAASCSLKEQQDQIIKQKANLEGIISRGFSQTFCDVVNLKTDAQATQLLPVVEGSGFAFMGYRYEDDWVRKMTEMSPCDFVILPHLYADKTNWELEVRVFDGKEHFLIATHCKSFSISDSSGSLHELMSLVMSSIGLECDATASSMMQMRPEEFAFYIDGNESCLALTLATQFNDGGKNLYGERSIFDKLLDFALRFPKDELFKFMLISSLAKNKAYGSVIYIEYKERVEKLLSEQPSSIESKRILGLNFVNVFCERLI
jgi:tetratricopeptide (TPR) repeat protein